MVDTPAAADEGSAARGPGRHLPRERGRVRPDPDENTSGEQQELGASLLLISGCQDNQLSLDGDRNGLFTEQLLAVWDGRRVEPAATPVPRGDRGEDAADAEPNYFKVGVVRTPASRSRRPSRSDTPARRPLMPPRYVMRDVVVCIPGITGSVLRKDGRDVWNISGGAVFSALHLARQEHQRPEARGRSARRRRPRRRDHGAVGDPRRPPDPRPLEDRRLHEDAAAHRGDVRRHARREPLRVPVRLAPRQPRRRAAPAAPGRRVAARPGGSRRAPPTRSSIIVGHSMGGLIARYFLECLDGWRDTRRSSRSGRRTAARVNALGTLVNGKKIKFFDLTEVARSLTAIYQLLPTYPCYDGGDGKLVRVDEARHPAPRRGQGEGGARLPPRDRDAVEAHLDDPGRMGATTSADRRDQAADRAVGRARRRPGQALQRTIGGRGPRAATGPSRGRRRPRSSSRRLENAIFSAERHASLQNDDHVLLQLTGVLTGRTSIDWSRTSAPPCR